MVDSTVQLPEIVLRASQAWLLLHPWQRTQWAARQALVSRVGLCGGNRAS